MLDPKTRGSRWSSFPSPIEAEIQGAEGGVVSIPFYRRFQKKIREEKYAALSFVNRGLINYYISMTKPEQV